MTEQEERALKIKEEAEKVLNSYRNSITRKAFIQFTEKVMAILAEK